MNATKLGTKLGVWPNFVTFVGVWNACASIITLDDGKCSHEQIIQSGLNSNGFLCSMREHGVCLESVQ